MSDIAQLQTALTRIFHQEGQRIVFWNDPAQEFLDVLPSLELADVTTLRLDQTGALETKVRLERQDRTGKYLLYSPAEEPAYEDDWLLDIRLYSTPFRADRASILVQELGLHSQQMRKHLEGRRKFFDAKDRVQKLKALAAPTDNEIELDLKMMAIITKADQAEFFNIVQTVFNAWTDDGDDINLDSPPASWTQIEKYELDTTFWRLAAARFGYDDKSPSLRKLLARMMLSDFAHHLRDPKKDARDLLPDALRSLLLPEALRPSSVVCLSQWRDSASKADSYDKLSAMAAGLLKIEDYHAEFEIDALLAVQTFLVIEQWIASGLRQRVQASGSTINAEDVRSIVTQRQAGHWATVNGPSTKDCPRKGLHAVYEALAAAADFNALRNQYADGFGYLDAQTMYRAYETELYRFDQLYRQFCENADGADAEGWGIVKPLRDEIEAHYVNWYLGQLSLAWGEHLEPNDGLLAQWRIEDAPNQFRFYNRNVRPYLDGADTRRAYVIVSDAFRYEAAHELVAQLNGKYRFEANLSSQLGVLPSYTALGMAALLPHQRLAYKGTDVLADGKSTAGMDARTAVLGSVNGVACSSDTLMAMSKDEGREFVKDRRVVYIYHNTVDATGDSAATEGKTFQSVRSAITEISDLTRFIANNLNGHHILITADHGFLFSETAPSDPDKSKLSEKPLGAVVAKKRYVIGTDLPTGEAAWRGDIRVTADIDGDEQFLIPRGANRFHFVGGARFVHGGAMPQEIVVPVVTVKQVKGKAAQDTKIKTVEVHVLGQNHRITAATWRIELMQVEPVSDRVKPATLKVAVYDGDEAVTNVQTVKFDSASSDFDGRKKWIHFALKDRPYDKRRRYRLVIRDADDIEQQSADVIIDRIAHDDF